MTKNERANAASGAEKTIQDRETNSVEWLQLSVSQQRNEHELKQ